MTKLFNLWLAIRQRLDNSGLWIATLLLRLTLAWEFYEAGIMKLGGDNWFESIKDNFPFPFNVIPTDISWFIATWFEILGGIGLALGLFTRFWSISLIILTIVAVAGVHWPSEWHSLSELAQGYVISNKGHGNFKLPFIFLVMFIPLLLQGAGRLSVDHYLFEYFKKRLAQ